MLQQYGPDRFNTHTHPESRLQPAAKSSNALRVHHLETLEQLLLAQRTVEFLESSTGPVFLKGLLVLVSIPTISINGSICIQSLMISGDCELNDESTHVSSNTKVGASPFVSRERWYRKVPGSLALM